MKKIVISSAHSASYIALADPGDWGTWHWTRNYDTAHGFDDAHGFVKAHIPGMTQDVWFIRGMFAFFQEVR